MRGLIFAVAVMLAGVAHAGDFSEPVIFGVTSTITISGVSIATQTATDVVISTNLLYRQVCVQNLDTNAYIACGDTVNVSTTAANALAGVQIAKAPAAGPAIPFCFELVPGKRFWCESASVTAASPASIIRKR